VDGFQEFTVVVPRLSTVRLRGIKHFQHDRPIALCHSCQHVRLPYAGHAVIRTKPDSGIRQKRMSGIPSTQPSVPMLTDDSQIGAGLRVYADEDDRTDFDQRR
jgi:hypothetical protein